MKKIIFLILIIIYSQKGFSQVVELNEPEYYDIKLSELNLKLAIINDEFKNSLTDNQYWALDSLEKKYKFEKRLLDEKKMTHEIVGIKRLSSLKFISSAGIGFTNNLLIPEVTILSVKLGEDEARYPLTFRTTLIDLYTERKNEKAAADILSPTGGLLNSTLSIEQNNKFGDYTYFNFVFQPCIKLIQCRTRESDELEYFGDINFNGYIKFQTAAWSNGNISSNMSDGIFFIYTGFGWNIPVGGFRNSMFYGVNDSAGYSVNFASLILKTGMRVNRKVDVYFNYVKCLAREISLPKNELVSINASYIFN